MASDEEFEKYFAKIIMAMAMTPKPVSDLVNVHSPDKCKGYACAIHNPSDHCMRDFPQLWRDDRKLMERKCPHGIGHPDPDHMDWYGRTHNDKETWAEGIHGCDGCCQPGGYERIQYGG